MTAVLHQSPPAASFIIDEEEMSYCRNEVTVSASQTIKAGDLLEADTANVVLRTSGTVTGIAIYPVTTGSGETKKTVALVRGPATVNENVVRWNKFTVGAPTHTGTGNGALTRASPAFSVAAQVGTYRIVCVAASTDAGTFDVIKPDGTKEGQATVAVAYTGSVKFTIADSTTDAAVGDEFRLAVTADNATEKGQLLALGIRAR